MGCHYPVAHTDQLKGVRSMPQEKSSDTCSLAGVDRRLEDAHRLWHQAEAAYFEPDGFRLAIQNAIQTLRTVTFVLQKHKESIHDFDAWYEGWQNKLRADALMVWMVDARNRIEKQGDLEAHSFLRAEIVASYLDPGPTIEIPAKLFDSTPKIVGRIGDNAALRHVLKHGTLRIERRWVENTLPDYELLDAVSIAYGRISELVSDAHRQMGLECPVTIDVETGHAYDKGALGGRMPCMIGHGDARATFINLADGQEVGVSWQSSSMLSLPP